MRGIYLFLMARGYNKSTLDMLTTDNVMQLARDVWGWMK